MITARTIFSARSIDRWVVAAVIVFGGAGTLVGAAAVAYRLTVMLIE